MPVPAACSTRVLPLWLAMHALACAGGDGVPVDAGPVDFFELLASPDAPAIRPPGRAELASSRYREPASGRHNQDWGNYVRVDGRLGVLLEEQGPGVITRLWLTQRAVVSAPAVEEDLVLHLWVDGDKVSFPGAGDAIGLRQLTSGSVEGFPEPWVAGPMRASGSLLVTVPIHFQRRIRLATELRDGFDTYYMVDWRALPGSVVRSFDGTLSPAQAAWLDEATRVWVDRAHEPEAHADRTVTLEPGASAEVVAEGGGVARQLVIGSPAGLGALAASLVVDGFEVVDGPAQDWLAAAPPGAPYRTALAGLDEAGGAELAYPVPFEEGLRLTVRNEGAGEVEVHLRVAWDPGVPAPELGRLRIECRDQEGAEGANVTVADLAGPGHVAGQALTMDAHGYGFAMLEGDPEIFADDRALLGTGIEDLFGGAHYFIYGPFALPEQALTGLAGDAARPVVAMQRHMLVSGIELDRRLRFTYEVWDPGTRYRSCTYWYRTPGRP